MNLMSCLLVCCCADWENPKMEIAIYSSEFNRSFDTRHSVCSIKQDENGKFDFKIDGVSHVSWFRKKKNEFREAIGIPKPRQNRSMKL